MGAGALRDDLNGFNEQTTRLLTRGQSVLQTDAAPGLTVVLEDNPRVIRAVGEVDIATADLLSHFLEQEVTHGESIVLDLSAVGFIDSSGVAILLRALVAMDQRAELIIRSPSRQARRVLTLSGLDRRPRLRILE